MNCGSKGMKKGGKVAASMVSPRKAMAMKSASKKASGMRGKKK